MISDEADEPEYDWTDDRETDFEREAARGTAACDGACTPQCDWCLVGHACPDQCGGGAECPYVGLETKR